MSTIDKADRITIRQSAIDILSVIITNQQDLEVIIGELSLEKECLNIAIKISSKDDILEALKTKE